MLLIMRSFSYAGISVEEFPDLRIAIQAYDKRMGTYVMGCFQKEVKNNFIGIIFFVECIGNNLVLCCIRYW